MLICEANGGSARSWILVFWLYRITWTLAVSCVFHLDSECRLGGKIVYQVNTNFFHVASTFLGDLLQFNLEATALYFPGGSAVSFCGGCFLNFSWKLHGLLETAVVSCNVMCYRLLLKIFLFLDQQGVKNFYYILLL